MKKLSTVAAAFAAVLLLAIPAQSQAFFGFFGGGFSFGVGGGWGGWGGPGWWGPGYWGGPYRYRGYYPYWRRGLWHRPYLARRFWGYPYAGYGYLGVPYPYQVPVAVLPTAPTVKAPEVKEK